MQNFVHLRLHTEFSIDDGILHVEDAVRLAKSDEMFALAITDLNNVFGLVKFYKYCRKNGIKPIIGAEINVLTDDNDEMHYKILLLAKNYVGYRQISELITRAYSDGKINDMPYVSESWLLNSVYSDIIMLSGAILGDVGKLIILNKFDQALQKASMWSKVFPNNYYLELQRFANLDADQVLIHSIEIANKLELPVVATHPIQFGKANDYLAHEIRVCVADGVQLEDDRRRSKFSQDQYFKSQKEMLELFSDIPSSITNTIEIAKRCNVEIVLGTYFLPDFVTPSNISIDEYLTQLANNGLKNRLNEINSNSSSHSNSTRIVYSESDFYKRLTSELKIIAQMGFSGYFLIVADFVNWAKSNNIPVGPGRGSGAGSLVAFALGITDVEPLRYGLLFERFLNPERVSMPDFDIDFCQDKRELVIEYVKNKYGADSVAQIATFGTMSSKAVIKDVGRALSLPYGLCDALSKMILNTPAKSFGLLEAYEKFPELKIRIDQGDDSVKRLWELSLQLENVVRSVGKHAAGVIISPGKLTNFCPLYIADGMQTSQMDKDDVEELGLVKFDFLGLRNLTTIQETLENIKIYYGIDLELSNYEFNDKETYKLLQQGNSASVFQLESQGMRRVLVKLEPDRFEDIIALLALYRPGPLGSGMVDDFIKRKKGEQIPEYYHDDLRACLEPTYGVIVYQEQVMQISQIIGGYTLGGADLLRRAMGKKKPEEMAKHKSLFLNGALNKGYSKELAENLFDLMAKFAEYGFNQSHSAAYAVISYHTAYLKAHYKACFMAATLSSELDKTDKLYECYQDCLENDLVVLPPDVNLSDYRFKVMDDKTIRYALGAIKGVGLNVVELLIKERNTRPFSDFVDFCSRVDKKVMNKKVIENLVKSGAFDNLEPNRSKLFNNISYVMDELEKNRQNEHQGSLFDLLAQAEEDNTFSNEVILIDYPRWSLKEQLLMEKQALGYYFSASLFEEYKDLVKKLEITPLNNYSLDNDEMQTIINRSGRERKKISVCGIISYISSRPLKKGGKMLFVGLEDDTGVIEVVIFNEQWEQYKQLLKVDELIFIEGELMYDTYRNQIKITAESILTLNEILAKQVTKITLCANASFDSDKFAPMLGNNGARVIMHYSNDVAKCRVEFGDEYQFIVNYENLSKVCDIMGKNTWMIN